MMSHKLGIINKSQLGFTLMEVMLVLAISGMISAGITMTLYQVVTGSTRTSNHMTVISQVQNAGHWISRDAQLIQGEPDIVKDGDDQLQSITLTWTDWSGTANTVIYTFDGAELWRDDGVQQARIAQFINLDKTKTMCDFTDGVLTFMVTVTIYSGSQEQSETRVYRIVPRPGS
jgi:prepilin-type N-terminal cleavage/methylation domain-containing protein